MQKLAACSGFVSTNALVLIEFGANFPHGWRPLPYRIMEGLPVTPSESRHPSSVVSAIDHFTHNPYPSQIPAKPGTIESPLMHRNVANLAAKCLNRKNQVLQYWAPLLRLTASACKQHYERAPCACFGDVSGKTGLFSRWRLDCDEN
jgi:hypothetical protein